MATTREHAFADGQCVWCPMRETDVNRMRAENQTPTSCYERWIIDPTISAIDDYDAIRERLKVIRAGEKSVRDPNDLSDFV